MKPHYIKRLLMALICAIAMGAGIRTAKADCCIVLPSYPSNVLSIFITDYVSPDTLFDFTITNGTLIPPGTYGGWCIDANDAIDPRQGNTVNGTVYTGELLSTCDTNELAQIPNHGGNPPVGPPPITSVATWHELNYLINHRPTNDYWDVQVAINSIIGGPPVYNGDGNPADDAYPTINTNVVQTLVSNTMANAASWHAQCGDKVAIVYVVNPPTTNTLEQLVILEVPCCSISFTTIPTNTCLGCNPTNIPVCQNPVNTNCVNAVSCCGHPVTITCSSSDSMVNCTKYRTFTYTATDAYGYSATASYWVCWTVDTNTPVITVTPGVTALGCNPTTLPTTNTILSQISVSNVCSTATVAVTSKDSGTPCSMSRTFTITATDACGNVSAPKTVVYTWTINTNAPVIITVPPSTNLGCNPMTLPSDTNISAAVVASDTCSSATVHVSHVDSGSPCSMERTFSIYATDACGNISATNIVIYTWKVETNAPVVTCPPDYYITNGVTTVTCFDQNGWNGNCTNNPCGILSNCFNKIYTNGYILCGVYGYNTRCFACTSPQCVENLLPCSGTPGCLPGSCLNPTNCGAGCFAGHVLCLQLNCDFCDNSNITGFKGCLGNLVLCNPSCPLKGCTVRQVLGYCQNALGCGSLPNGCTLGQLNDLCSNINCSFGNCGTPTPWCCTNLGGITTTNVPPSVSGYATATNGCGDNLTITYSDVITQDSCGAGAYTIQRTWKATDACGNAGTCTQNIFIGTKSSICGYVFQDCTGYGYLAAGIDVGLSNIVVTLSTTNGTVITTTNTTGAGSYCFNNLAPGTYVVSVNIPTNYAQVSGCSTTHWLDTNQNDCWIENDGYQHCKGSSGVDCWTDKSGYQHCLNSYGQDCWKDSSGICHTQNCTYTSCNLPKGSSEIVTITGCESLNTVNFSYQGVTPQCSVCVTGPSSGRCGQTCSYTCTVTNTGSCCLNTCNVTCCGNSYPCPSLQPGQCCSFQFNYCYKNTDCGNFNCQATASCNYNGSSNPCTSRGSCNTWVSLW